MKKINEFRKLLGVDKEASLKDLKTIYRNAMKDTHPDKFVDDEVGKLAAEESSKNIIEAYHYLVSINPETHDKNLEEYTETINNSIIQDFYLEKQILYIIHTNGVTYEYMGISRNLYTKMINSDSPSRFARRHIYGKFTFRKGSSATVEA
ncbi:KTSC domain-containing protein [Soonwooa purpurea]